MGLKSEPMVLDQVHKNEVHQRTCIGFACGLEYEK
jgi:hypothetical protein